MRLAISWPYRSCVKLFRFVGQIVRVVYVESMRLEKRHASNDTPGAQPCHDRRGGGWISRSDVWNRFLPPLAASTFSSFFSCPQSSCLICSLAGQRGLAFIPTDSGRPQIGKMVHCVLLHAPYDQAINEPAGVEESDRKSCDRKIWETSCSRSSGSLFSCPQSSCPICS